MMNNSISKVLAPWLVDTRWFGKGVSLPSFEKPLPRGFEPDLEETFDFAAAIAREYSDAEREHCAATEGAEMPPEGLEARAADELYQHLVQRQPEFDILEEDPEDDASSDEEMTNYVDGEHTCPRIRQEEAHLEYVGLHQLFHFKFGTRCCCDECAGPCPQE